jgi:ribokinase
MKLLDVICVGDAMVDLFLTLPKNDSHIISHDNKIEFVLGDKIHIEKGKLVIGGIACNVAVGLSRLGNKIGFAGELGNDVLATKIIQTLENENIDTSLLAKGDKESSLAVGVQHEKDRILFVEHVRRQHDISFVDASSPWIYLAGIGDVWQHAYKQTLEYVARSGAKLAFTPGSTQLHSDEKVLFDVIKNADILLLNKEEAEHILLTQNLPFKDPKTIITQLISLGPKVVSVTDGINGSFSGDGEYVYSLPIYPAEVVEKTGAGDAYATGFLAAFIHGKDIKTAMKWGGANAASVVTKVGAQEGLLTKDAIEAKLEQHKNVEVTEL